MRSSNKGWMVVSEYLGRDPVVFDSLEELLEAARQLGMDPSEWAILGGNNLAARAYSGGAQVIEGIHHDFQRDKWLRNPDWHTIAVWEEGEAEE